MQKLAFIFPGQGSQTVGMLADLINTNAVRNTLVEASDILKIDMLRLIQEGPQTELDLTTNTQPVMLTAALAFYRAYQEAEGITPTLLAGHSLGEYSALVVADVLAFSDALPLVRFRAQAMQEAVPVGIGAMAAILGLSAEEVMLVCQDSAQQECVEAVNFNAPGQIVIAGHKTAVERACLLAKERGAKRALLLPVSAPFHSSLLQPASLRLRDYLKDVQFNAPKIQVINNVDVAILHEPEQIKEALVQQAAKPVRWIETIQKMAQLGVTQIVECGPGKVLSGLTKRIEPSISSQAIVDQNSLQQLLTTAKVL